MKNKNRLIISISSDIGFELAKDWLKKDIKFMVLLEQNQKKIMS